VDPNVAMLQIIDVQDFHLELMAYNGVGEQFEIGQQVLWTPGRQDGQRYKAEVFALSPQVDEANNSYQVFCEPVDRDIPGIRPGMFVTGFIQTAADSGTVLPSAAIVEYEGDNWIYTATQSDSGYVFHPAKVEVLLERENQVLVNLATPPVKGLQLVGEGVYYVHSALQNKLFGE
jgi:multidrug efflux pump subunit AcrA (membrane-fusion protein)